MNIVVTSLISARYVSEAVCSSPALIGTGTNWIIWDGRSVDDRGVISGPDARFSGGNADAIM
jgi:hypothetical protein